VLGAQCVHGAVETGELAARQLLRVHQFHAVKELAGETPALCVCNGGEHVWDSTRFTQPMISCDQCHRWYHGTCLGIDIAKFHDSDTFVCPKCRPMQPKPWP
jgi:hypothetical protein